MAKKSKKALGAAMAGVMAVGAVAGANTMAAQVQADVASDVKAADAKLNHLANSLHNNYLGLKNQPTWELYAKEAKDLIAKLPNGSTKEKFQARLDRANAMILAAASVNHAEFSIQKNFPKADNANQWIAYADKSLANIQIVEKGGEYTDRLTILQNRIEKVQEFAAAVLDLEEAREAEDVESMVALKEDAADLMDYFENEMNYKGLMKYNLVDVIDQRIEEAGGLDQEAPVLKYDGSKAITVENGAKFELPTVTATDDVDEKVEVKAVIKDAAGKEIKAIDTKVAGTYTVTYTAEDAAGNVSDELVITVTVKEAKPVVESVNAINSKTLEVKFDGAVDSSKAKFAVTKDTFKVNIASVTWNADKTIANLELTSKLTKGEYVVNVTGVVEDETLKGSINAEDEKVADIEILSDVAPLVSDTQASVGYKIVNQYGEDLTKIEDLEVSLSGAKNPQAVNGKLTFDSVEEKFKVDSKVVVTLIHKASATSATKTLTIANQAKASEVSFGAVYNKDGKTLNEDINLSTDKFYLPLEVKDQYGNAITDATKIKKDDLFVTNTNTLAVGVDLANLTTIKIGDKDTVVLPLKAPAGKTNAVAGDSTITIIAAASGKNTQAKVTVAESVRTDVVKFGPATAFAGEETLVPITVFDKQGNEIKDLKVLKDSVKGVKVTSKVGTTQDDIIEKDGVLYIKVAALASKNDVHTVVVQSSTNKVATLTLTAKEGITPKVITGLNSKVSTSIREIAGAKVEIEGKDIVVEDQYGQVISSDKLLGRLGTDYEIIAKTIDGAPFTIEGKITKDGGKISITYKAGQDRTSANVTFKLAKKDDKGAFVAQEASSFAKEFSIVKDSAFASYKVDDIAPVYVKNADGYSVATGYERDIVVKAVTSAGGEVKLEEGKDYTVKSTVLAGVADSKIDGADVSGIKFEKDATTTTAKVVVTINGTGEEIVKDVTFSTVAPKIAKVEAVKNGTVVNEAGVAQTIDEDTVLKAASSSITYSDAAAFGIDALEGLVDFVVTDTYGVRVALDEKDDTITIDGKAVTPTLTLSKVSGEVKFSDNGTKEASVNEISANSVFNARLNASGVSADTIRITATESYSKTGEEAVKKETAKTEANNKIKVLTDTYVGKVDTSNLAAAKAAVEAAKSAVTTYTGLGGATADLTGYADIAKVEGEIAVVEGANNLIDSAKTRIGTNYTFNPEVKAADDNSVALKAKLEGKLAGETAIEGITLTVTKVADNNDDGSKYSVKIADTEGNGAPVTVIITVSGFSA